ncbi:MAG: hypothetical protein ABH834_00655 [Candidatus Altiarchaeota archaeon]
MSKQRKLQNKSRSGSSPSQKPYLRHDEVVRRAHLHQHLTDDEIARLKSKNDLPPEREVYSGGPRFVQSDAVLPLEPARIIDQSKKKRA